MTPATFKAQLAILAARLFGSAARHLTRRQRAIILYKLASRDPDADQVDFKAEPIRTTLKVPTLD